MQAHPRTLCSGAQVNPVHLVSAAGPDVQDKLGKQMGMQLVGGGPDELAALMAKEIPRWAALVKKSGASAN